MMDRRTFLKIAGTVGAVLGGTVTAQPAESVFVPMASTGVRSEQPNILVIMVDQLRYPQWFPNQASLDVWLPNLARLRSGAVNFTRHYTAANACTPARACLLTGLYAHQTACLQTITSPEWPGLHPGFPTWGMLLRELGYRTQWYGKWHLNSSTDLAPYGFDGTTYVTPPGKREVGSRQDPEIVDQFVGWLQAQGDDTPWCTTVSLINPHDVAGYFQYTDQAPYLVSPPRVFQTVPPNFETPADREAQGKPGLQQAQLAFTEQNFGALPFEGDGFEAGWLKLLDLYLLLHRFVDMQIGRVLDALNAHPAADRTIVIFTSDHGEYGGSHGLRGKGGAAYEEAIRVPLYVKDPTGRFGAMPEVNRTQLTSSVDITPLLLTIASGGDSWRTQPHYAHLAGRLNLAAIVRDPDAAGRRFVLHTSDERQPAVLTADTDPPLHVIAMRLPAAKLGVYSHWTPGTIDLQSEQQETELYDYRTQEGQYELANSATTQAELHASLYNGLIDGAIPGELRKPLPPNLQQAQQEALNAYLAAVSASASVGSDLLSGS